MSEQRTEDLPPDCPSCGATVRSDVPWCTQCYAPLRPRESSPQGGSDGVDDDATARRAQDPVEVERVAEQMLAELTASRSEVQGWAARLPSSPGTRMVLLAVVIVVVTALIVLLMFLVGSAL
ncbi:MAG TPA: hypothetical protein VFL94_00925 [Actinomycetales bacterium]|nr:hypothetical protein [Actinomycetales bacterium]